MTGERLRLRDVDPEAMAAALANQLLRHASAQLAAATSGDVADALRALARYARGEGLGAQPVGELLQSIAPLYRSVTQPDAHPVPAPSNPTTPLEMVVAAALARLQIDSGRDIGCTELALLTGIHRDHLTAIAREIPTAYRVGKDKDSRMPWRFKPTKALRQWIADKALIADKAV